MTIYSAQQAHDDITALFDAYYSAKKEGASVAQKERNEGANALVEQYIESNGERPPASVLSRLATYLLLDNLTDSHPDKMSRDEYPIMSYGQLERHLSRVYYERAEVIENNFGRLDIYNEWATDVEYTLSLRDYYIIRRIFNDESTQSEVAVDLGISRARVGVLVDKSIKILREVEVNAS